MAYALEVFRELWIFANSAKPCRNNLLGSGMNLSLSANPCLAAVADDRALREIRSSGFRGKFGRYLGPT